MKHGVCAELMDGVNDIVEPEGSGFDVTKSRFESENQHYSVLLEFIIRLTLKLWNHIVHLSKLQFWLAQFFTTFDENFSVADTLDSDMGDILNGSKLSMASSQ